MAFILKIVNIVHVCVCFVCENVSKMLVLVTQFSLLGLLSLLCNSHTLLLPFWFCGQVGSLATFQVFPLLALSSGFYLQKKLNGWSLLQGNVISFLLTMHVLYSFASFLIFPSRYALSSSWSS